MSDIFEAKDKVKNILKNVPGIKGTGITWDDDDKCSILVNVDLELNDDNRRKIPHNINGVPVIISKISDINLE